MMTGQHSAIQNDSPLIVEVIQTKMCGIIPVKFSALIKWTASGPAVAYFCTAQQLIMNYICSTRLVIELAAVSAQSKQAVGRFHSHPLELKSYFLSLVWIKRETDLFLCVVCSGSMVGVNCAEPEPFVHSK